MTKTTAMREKEPLVSIVILNWNGTEDTIRCMESVDKLSYQNIEVIIIDNGSEKPITKSDLIDRHTKFKIIKNEKNLGFAGGQISALPYCKGDYLFLLNNDALIDKSAITNALKVFKTDSKIAVVGGKSYSLLEEGNISLSFYAFQYIDPVTADVKTHTNDSHTQDTLTVSGSAVMIKRSIIDACGYFDERFFAYYEETDLFAKYLRLGFRVVYEPSVVILHKDGASTKNKRFMYYYLMLKNQFLFAYKNFDNDSKKRFLKTYTRNFRRSLWMYLKDRSKVEAIHKARVRSTIWNLVNLFSTIASRHATLSLNRDFNYNHQLYTRQPLNVTFIIDATMNIDTKKLRKYLTQLLSFSVCPSEIIIVSSKPILVPSHPHSVTVRNIVDKKLLDVSVADFGFMSSNTDILISITYDQLLNINTSLQDELMAIYNTMTSEEAAFATETFKGSDLNITNNSSATLMALRKSDLVDFLVINTSTYSITDTTIGEFINWAVMECKPVARIPSQHHIISKTVNTPISHFPILHSALRWNTKKVMRKLHITRLISKVRKILTPQKNQNQEIQNIKETPSPLRIPSKKQMLKTPIFINTRDRSEPLVKLLSWLHDAGYENIIFIDNDSTYPGLLDIFTHTPSQVVPLGRNGMHRAPWESFAVRFFAKDQPYIVTDPDIIPTNKTPLDTIEHLYRILHKYPAFKKCGVALKIDDLPDHYSMKQAVLNWESRFWDKATQVEKDVYNADVDTTFALYREKTSWFLSPSLRIAGVYAMRHEPWYQDLDAPSDDMMYYRARASNEVSTWTKGVLPKHHLRALKKEGLL